MEWGHYAPISKSVAYIKNVYFSIFLIFQIYIINMNKKERKSFAVPRQLKIRGRIIGSKSAMICGQIDPDYSVTNFYAPSNIGGKILGRNHYDSE